jgi:hypothetical protein
MPLLAILLIHLIVFEPLDTPKSHARRIGARARPQPIHFARGLFPSLSIHLHILSVIHEPLMTRPLAYRLPLIVYRLSFIAPMYSFCRS